MSDRASRAGAAAVMQESVKIGTTPDIISSKLVLRFHAFWAARCRDDALPAKRDMDPVDMRAFLPNLILTEVLHEPMDFRYRIIGEAIVDRLGNVTGKRVGDAALINVTSSAYGNYRAVAQSGQAQFLEGMAALALRQDRRCLMSRVHCPLSSDGARVDHIISCVSFL